MRWTSLSRHEDESAPFFPQRRRMARQRRFAKRAGEHAPAARRHIQALIKWRKKGCIVACFPRPGFLGQFTGTNRFRSRHALSMHCVPATAETGALLKHDASTGWLSKGCAWPARRSKRHKATAKSKSGDATIRTKTAPVHTNFQLETVSTDACTSQCGAVAYQPPTAPATYVHEPSTVSARHPTPHLTYLHEPCTLFTPPPPTYVLFTSHDHADERSHSVSSVKNGFRTTAFCAPGSNYKHLKNFKERSAVLEDQHAAWRLNFAAFLQKED